MGTSNIAETRVGELVTAIGSARISPGSGAAGAVALALAAACAAKAAAISVKHQAEPEALEGWRAALERIAHFALTGADQDADAFTAFIRRHDLDSVSRLIREGDRTGRLMDVLAHVLDEMEPAIEEKMSGDMVAARVLLAAARQIIASNAAEARGERAGLIRS